MATFTPDTTNTLFQLAAALINQSNRSIFLTGKAGTGKTTFLKYIRENCPKQMAVVAPTGVAVKSWACLLASSNSQSQAYLEKDNLPKTH